GPAAAPGPSGPAPDGPAAPGTLPAASAGPGGGSAGSAAVPAGGTPKLTDFGLARTVEGGLSVSGEVLGTPSYMPPEQARGELKRIGPASDVYSLGALLYALLTGRPPFQAATAWETVVQVISDEPVPP